MKQSRILLLQVAIILLSTTIACKKNAQSDIQPDINSQSVALLFEKYHFLKIADTSRPGEIAGVYTIEAKDLKDLDEKISYINSLRKTPEQLRQIERNFIEESLKLGDSIRQSKSKIIQGTKIITDDGVPVTKINRIICKTNYGDGGALLSLGEYATVMRTDHGSEPYIPGDVLSLSLTPVQTQFSYIGTIPGSSTPVYNNGYDGHLFATPLGLHATNLVQAFACGSSWKLQVKITAGPTTFEVGYVLGSMTYFNLAWMDYFNFTTGNIYFS